MSNGTLNPCELEPKSLVSKGLGRLLRLARLQGAETATTLSIGSERGGSSSEKLAVISILSCMAADVDAMLPGSSITVSGMPKLLACLRIFSGVCGTLAIEI
jgi:hypothetical protein